MSRAFILNKRFGRAVTDLLQVGRFLSVVAVVVAAVVLVVAVVVLAPQAGVCVRVSLSWRDPRFAGERRPAIPGPGLPQDGWRH